MTMTLLIDSVDYSAHLTKRGYTAAYKAVLGANSCYTLDGTYHEDVLAYKAVITVPLNPLTTAQVAALLNACHNCKTATYFDAKTNTTVTKNAKVTLSAAGIALNKSTAVFWGGQGLTLTIEEM